MCVPANPFLIAVVGPTAVGKTATAIAIAQQFEAEIVSADSRQFYQEMSIGTAKPTPEELAVAPHHFVDFLSVTQHLAAGEFEKRALAKISELHQKQPAVVLSGGSGLYVDAVCNGFDELPTTPDSIREKYQTIFEEKGIEELQKRVEEKDPEYYKTVDRNNPRRLIRALEVIEVTGKPFSSFHQKSPQPRPFSILKIGLELDRETLYERINNRVDLMLENGLLEEAKALHPKRGLVSLETVGYTELFNYFEGKIPHEEAIRLIKRNSRRYAKRQMTWWRKDPNIHWFNPNEESKIVDFISEKLKSKG